VTHSVRWEEDVRSAVAGGVASFIECGPGKILAGMLKRIDKSLAVSSVSEWSEVEALPKVS